MFAPISNEDSVVLIVGSLIKARETKTSQTCFEGCS
jgi:hypothetical protein